MILRPLHDKIVVKQREVHKMSKGGIAIVADKHEKPLKGDVVAVGPGRYLGDVFVKTTLKEGDVIIFGKNAGDEIEFDNDTTFVVMKEREVLAVIDE